MALTIYTEVSTTGYADGDFTPLTNAPDVGDPITYDHSPVEPGQLYIYRARRFDSETGLFSSWAYAFARAPYPQRATAMIDTQEVLTNSDERFFVGIEAFENVPTQAVYQAELVSGSTDYTLGRRYSRIKRKTKTARRNVVKGPISYKPSYTFEVRGEGATTAFFAAALMYESTTALTGPTRYRHRYSNKKGLKSLTIIHQTGDTYDVYVGCKVTKLGLSPDWNGTDTLLITVELNATGFIGFEKSVTPTVETILGISTAVADLSTPYAPDDGSVFLNGIRGAGAQSLDANLENTFAEYKERDGTRSPKGFVEEMGDPSVTVNAYYNKETMKHRYRDFGYSSNPTAPFGPQRGAVITAPISLIFSPPATGGGVINTLAWIMPQCDVQTKVNHQDKGEVQLGITGSPIDAPGEESQTDLYVELTNTLDETEIVAPGVPIDPTAFPPADDRTYEYGKATGVPTTTSVASAGNLHLDTTDDLYIGRRLRFITGSLAGIERPITDYVGASRTFTTTAFGGAAAAGDHFVIL